MTFRPGYWYNAVMKTQLEYLKLNGQEARSYTDELAKLRLKVFHDFPYLYEGSLEYEKNYLETYFKAKHSFLLLVRDQGKLVGATTAIWAQEEEASFREPFLRHGLDPKKILYFGESILLSEYRGLGVGKVFFAEREKFARSLDFVELMSFCAVQRKDDDPRKPQDYRPLDSFWMSQGFHKESGLETEYEWPDIHESISSKKKMQFWMKWLKDK